MTQYYPDYFDVSVDPSVPITGGMKVSHDGGKTWQSTPDILFARIYYSHSDPFLDKLFEDLPAPSVRHLRHKVQAIRYHKERYLAFEVKEQQRLNSAPPSQGVESVIDNPEPIYDLEAFLFQVKSCLDVAMLILKNNLTDDTRHNIKGFNHSNVNGQKIAGQKTVKALHKYLEKNQNDQNALAINETIILINNAQSWTTELVSMRDIVTHCARLDILWFVSEPYTTIGKSRVRFPRLPANVHDIRTAQYINETWQKLIDFLERYLDIVRKIRHPS